MLPQSGLRLSLPLWKYSMAVRTPERPVGVRPDVPVAAWMEGGWAGRDTVLDVALEMAADAAAEAEAGSAPP